MLEHAGVAAFGRAYPEFWVAEPHDGGQAKAGNGLYIGFLAQSRSQVDAFLREGAGTIAPRCTLSSRKSEQTLREYVDA